MMPRQSPGITPKQMCEFIAEVHFERTGKCVDPVKDIWLMSPTGELWPIFEAYEAAKAWKEQQT